MNYTIVDTLPQPPPSRIHPVVLVVDDDPHIQHSLGRLLRMHGFEVHAASDAAQAIELASTFLVDAAILDLSLPRGESGLDVLAWFRSRLAYHALPVLILTGHLEVSEEAEELIRRQYAYVFYKPQPSALLVEYLTRLTRADAPPQPSLERGESGVEPQAAVS